MPRPRVVGVFWLLPLGACFFPDAAGLEGNVILPQGDAGDARMDADAATMVQDAPGEAADGAMTVYDATSPCKTKVPNEVFCDDFEGESSSFENWSWHYETVASGLLKIDSTQSASPNNSAYVEIPSAGIGTGNMQMAAIAGAGSKITVSFALKVVAISNVPQTTIVQVNSGGFRSEVQLVSDGARLETSNGAVDVLTPPVNEWFTMTLKIDGVNVLLLYTTKTGTKVAATATNKAAANGSFTVILGEVYDVGTSSQAILQANFDNVLITAP